MSTFINVEKPRTLVILSPGFPKDESDSTCMTSQQSFVLAVNKAFPDLKVMIIAFQYPYHKKSYRWFGNDVIPTNAKSLPKALRPVVWFKVMRILNRIHHEIKIVGLLSFWCNETALIGSYFARSKSLKHLTWILGQDARASNFFVKLINPKSNSLVALSPFVKREFEKNHGINPSYIIQNGVDVQMFNGHSIEKNIDIIGVGSLTNLKQYHLFVEVVKELTERFQNLKVLLVGEGEQRKKLEAQAKMSRLENVITFTGEIDHMQAIDLMKRSKILIHPSSYEGYSTVCLEALASGCHVVSFISAEEKIIPQWHIVRDVKSMEICCAEILTNEKEFNPVVLHTLERSAKQMINLFSA